MSACVLTAYASEKLPPLLYEQSCGKIFITHPHNTVVLRCSLCETELHTCEDFLAHICTHYAIKTEAQELSEATQLQATEDAEALSQQWTETKSEYEKKQIHSKALTTQTDDELLEPMMDINILRKMPYPDILPGESEPKPTTLLKSKIRKKNKSIKESGITTTRKKEADGERNYSCKICGICYDKKPSLKMHLLRHTALKPFSCDECDKAFYTRGELKSHKRHHSGERPYICKYCGARFTTSSCRLRHERGHELRDSNNRPFPCDQCDRAFFDALHLRRHKIVHNVSERNHVCEICSAAFLRRRNLLQHMKSHSKVRDFVCNVCDKAFAARASLQLHQKNKHTVVEEEATCEICSAAFLRRKNLLQHMKSHSKVRDFVCKVCDKAFAARASLQLHQKNKHSVVEEEATLES